MFYQIQLNQLQNNLSPISKDSLPDNLSHELIHLYHYPLISDQSLLIFQYLKDIITSTSFNPFDSFSLWQENSDYYFLFDKLLLNESFLLNIAKNDINQYALHAIEHLYQVAQYCVVFPENKTVSLSIANSFNTIGNNYFKINDIDSLSLYLAASFRQDTHTIIFIENSVKQYIIDNSQVHTDNQATIIETKDSTHNIIHEDTIDISTIREQLFILHMQKCFNITLNNPPNTFNHFAASYQDFTHIFNWSDIIFDTIEVNKINPKKDIIDILSALNNTMSINSFDNIKDNLLSKDILEDKDFILQASKTHQFFPVFLLEKELIDILPLLHILQKEPALLGKIWTTHGKNEYYNYTINVEKEAHILAQRELVDIISMNLQNPYYKIDFIELSQYLSPELMNKYFGNYQVNHFPTQTSSFSENFKSWGYNSPQRTSIDIGLEFNACYFKQLNIIEQKNNTVTPIREIYQKHFSNDFNNVIDIISKHNYSLWPPIEDMHLTKEQHYKVYDSMLIGSSNTHIDIIINIPSDFFDLTLVTNQSEKDLTLERIHQYLLLTTNFIRFNPHQKLIDAFNTIPHLNDKDIILEVFSSYFNSSLFKTSGHHCFDYGIVNSQIVEQVLQKNPEFLYDTDICSIFTNIIPSFFKYYFLPHTDTNIVFNEHRMQSLFQLTDPQLIVKAIIHVKDFFNSPHMPRQWLTHYDCLLATFRNEHTQNLLSTIDFQPQEIETIFSLNIYNQNYSIGKEIISHCPELYMKLPQLLRSVKQYAQAYISYMYSDFKIDIDIIPSHLFSLDSFCLDIIDSNYSLMYKIPPYHWNSSHFISHVCNILDQKYLNDRSHKNHIIDNLPSPLKKLFSHFQIEKNYKEFFDSFSLQQQLEHKTQHKCNLMKKRKI